MIWLNVGAGFKPYSPSNLPQIANLWVVLESAHPEDSKMTSEWWNWPGFAQDIGSLRQLK